jgi:hypothetical protein
MKQVGFHIPVPELIKQYVSYGSLNLSRKALLGDQFDLREVEKIAQPHRKIVQKTVYGMKNLRVQIAKRDDFDTMGLVVYCLIGLRLEVDETDSLPPIKKSGVFSKNLLAIYTNWATGEGIWFLRKDGKLQRCRNGDEILAVEKMKGIFYVPDGPSSNLVFRLGVEFDKAKEIARQPDEYSIEIIFDHVHESSAVGEWGYYHRNRLVVESAGNSRLLIRAEDFGGGLGDSPAHFRPEGVKPPKLVRATLVAAKMRHRSSGTVIASYVRRNDYGELTFASPKLPETNREKENSKP